MKRGHVYKIKHSRKGTFYIKVIDKFQDFVKGELLDGEVEYLSRYTTLFNPSVKGDILTLRTDLFTYEEIEDEKK